MNETLYKTWEFKGIEIKPISNARKLHITKLVDIAKVTPWDIALLIFSFVCNEKILMRGLRNPEAFDEAATKWLNDNSIQLEDFDESAGSVVREVLEHSMSNRVVPVVDPSLAPDPAMGNE